MDFDKPHSQEFYIFWITKFKIAVILITEINVTLRKAYMTL